MAETVPAPPPYPPGPPGVAPPGSRRWLVFAIAGGALVMLLVAAVVAWFALVRPARRPGPGDPGRDAPGREPTREASGNTGGECRTVGSGGACQVAIVLDGRVLVAPEVIDVIVGPANITGQFTRDEVYLLAAQLAHGSQPLVLDVESFEQ